MKSLIYVILISLGSYTAIHAANNFATNFNQAVEKRNQAIVTAVAALE